MAPTRSQQYYFSRGDLVIQIEDTLFRLYSGILESHSDFFRDMLSMPSNDNQEGTSDECPLHLPRALCSADSFTTLCELICPKIMGVFPPILVKDFAEWERVLEATEALQMTGVQNFILARLQDDKGEIKTTPVRLLGWAIRSELPLEVLKLECFLTLAYRRRPLSETEVNLLGGKATAEVIRVREKIRGLFLSNSTSAESLLSHIHTHSSCTRNLYCRTVAFKQIIHNMTKDDPTNEQDDSDIFQIDSPNHLCDWGRCASKSSLDDISPSLRKAVLDDEVRRCVFGVEPPSALA